MFLRAGVLFMVGALACGPALAAQPRAEMLPAPATRLQWQGAGSCAAASCHGGQASPGHWRGSYLTWIGRDPHAKASQVLFDESARRIMKNLGRGDAHRDSLCLNCHVHPDWERTSHADRFAMSDGVSCESCHGPAEKWLARHHGGDWPLLSSSEKRALGWRETKDLVERARACTACHVGTAGSDVNHDLIAAGHPPLKFELSAYHSALPRHWSDRKDRARYPDLEARAWQIGQVVSAQAALEVLEHRAAGERQQPWPEFAEYDCFACHQSLRADKARPKRGERRPGTLPWSRWYFAMLPRVLHVDLPDLAELERHMERLPPVPGRVKGHAKLLRERLEPVLSRMNGSRILEPRQLFDRFLELARNGERATDTWDEATQLYQGLVAHWDCWRAADVNFPGDSKRLDTLRELAKTLAMPPGRGTPSPLQPARLRELFKTLSVPARKL